MKYKRSRKYLPYSFNRKYATAKCDTSGFKVLHKDLRIQYEWYGNTLTNTGYHVHKDFLTDPNPQGKVKSVGGDPFPVKQPRPFYVQLVTAITLLGYGTTVPYTIGSSAVIVAPQLTVTQANGVTSLTKGILHINVDEGVSYQDTLSISPVHGVTINNQLVIFGGTTIGSIDQVFNGKRGNILQINLTGNVSNTLATTIMQSINLFSTDTTNPNKSIKFVVINSNGLASDPALVNVLLST